MKDTFLESLMCNHCGNSGLELKKTAGSPGEILEGEIFCKACHAVFPIKDGIPEFFHDLSEDSLNEIVSSEGVATYCYPKEPDVYNDEWLLSLPYVQNLRVDNFGGWRRKISTFEQIISDSPIGRGKKLLDIGASTTWSTRFFAKKGYDCIALDIVKGKYRGLMSSRIFFQQDNTYYECILAPMERIPLKDSSIDCVFSINSLHHCNDLKSVFLEIYRVLRRGGNGYLLDDTVGFVMRKKKERAAERSRKENQHNDHVYSLQDYMSATKEAKLTLGIEIPQRFLDKVGLLRYLPKNYLYILYVLLSKTLGMPFYFRLGKN